jgi:hypothetical protein
MYNSDMRTWHAVTINGSFSFEVKRPIDEARELLRNTLARIDGKARYSLVLWAMPAGKRLVELDEHTDAREYIQCAGSAAAMTVEVRTEADGEGHQYVVGRLPGPRLEDPQVKIPWDDFEAVVYDDEVFTAEEAAELFGSYLESGTVPAEFALRPLSLAVDH